jgi:ABC-type dipeptide/oligopeptide/nickel transport system permease subunit
MSPLERSTARLWLSLPFVRRSRRLGVSTRRMVILYVLVNWWIVALIEAALNLATTGRIER